jgi:S-adenosylmethionine:tRNA ribosyltransferase-isomerase
MPFPKTNLSSYTYTLPEDKIAFNPVSQRENSKLLHYNNGGVIENRNFGDILEILTPTDTLFFNNAKVIPARIHVQKETGAFIEIFLLEPSNKDYSSLYTKENATWKCLVGWILTMNTQHNRVRS